MVAGDPNVGPMRRPLLITLSALLLLTGFAAFTWQIASSPTTLRVAVGPADGDDARLLTTVAATLARDREGLRLKIVPTRGAAESARALDADEVQLAVVRPDIMTPTKGQSVAIMHRDPAILLAPAGKPFRSVPDLSGRKIGIIRGMPANERILDALAAFYDLPAGSLEHVTLEGPADIEAALRSGRVDAILTVGPLGSRALSDTIAAVVGAGGGQSPVFVPIPEADAIAARSPVFESIEIGRGALGGSSVRPAEAFRTVSVNFRLMASTSLADASVSELTRLLFVLRPRIAPDLPVANRLEAPDISKSSVLPVHSGASAYYEGEIPTFLDRYEDWFYLGIMVLSILGSGFAGFASQAAGKRRARMLGMLGRLMAIVHAARAAHEERELTRLEDETDEILGTALERAGAGSLDDAGVSAFTLGLDQARLAIAERRRALNLTATPRLVHAAE